MENMLKNLQTLRNLSILQVFISLLCFLAIEPIFSSLIEANAKILAKFSALSFFAIHCIRFFKFNIVLEEQKFMFLVGVLLFSLSIFLIGFPADIGVIFFLFIGFILIVATYFKTRFRFYIFSVSLLFVSFVFISFSILILSDDKSDAHGFEVILYIFPVLTVPLVLLLFFVDSLVELFAWIWKIKKLR